MSEKKVIMDGNTAAGYIGYLMSELSIIYPITPSSPMSELNDEMASNDKLNLFGQTVKVIEMQSEAGAAGALHGSLAAGALTTTYTSSQGLLLMIPNMYKIAGECLPTVFHVAARTVASHALSIFGDHSDVMACRQTGFCMLAANNPQEALDLGFISHVATYKVSLPFLHFFDGFRTSHQINDIQAIDQKVMLDMLPLNEINRFRRQAHNPNHPHQSGTAQNPDIFFQNREASNILYNNAYDKVVNVMKEFGEKTGRKYQPFMYSGAHDATNVVIAMGSGADTISEACEYLIKNKKRAGLLKVHLYRPFNAKAFIAALPKTVRKIAVLDRTKEPGAVGEPLYLDVVTAIRELGNKSIKIYGGRYGLASKDFTVNDAVAVYRNLTNLNPKQHFTVGIDDDLTHHSLKSTIDKKIKSDAYEMKFFGLGSDGTVSANKSSIKIVGALTDLSVQGYFEYDSKKSGSLTISHLRTANHPIYNPYLVKQADFIAIHNYAFVHQYDVLDGLKTNGKVLLNTSLTDEQLGRDLPKEFKKRLKRAKAKLYVCPAFDVAKAAGLKNRINVVMQACFFKIADIIPYEQAAKSMKDFASKAYASKGEEILNANMKAIDNAIHDLREIDINQLVKITTKTFTVNHEGTKYYNNFVHKINHRLGDTMKVSEFDPSGSVPNGTTQYEKRGIAQAIPI